MKLFSFFFNYIRWFIDCEQVCVIVGNKLDDGLCITHKMRFASCEGAREV
ncbi:hypothetical protein HanRHA438_Chr15g0684521 [Helianthus annuus]|nr:hypothetical protein HanRHA438_Chr15g0684521 [Helianthus annuus]